MLPRFLIMAAAHRACGACNPMSRIMDKCRLCRRAGIKLYLKGDRCYTPKCAIVKRNYPPGVSGAKKGKSRQSSYALQLREKQKCRMYYGITEKQMTNCFLRATRSLGNSGELFVQSLEMRLDNIVYRLGWGSSHARARQLVNHGHIAVNGKTVTIPSYRVKPGQIISVKGSSQKKKFFESMASLIEKVQIPGWIHAEPKVWEGKVIALPTIAETNPLYDVRLITEFYSR